MITSEARRFRAPPIEGDPDAPSSDAYGATDPEKKSAADGCGSVAGSSSAAPFGQLVLMLLILLPLLYRDRRS